MQNEGKESTCKTCEHKVVEILGVWFHGLNENCGAGVHCTVCDNHKEIKSICCEPEPVQSGGE